MPASEHDNPPSQPPPPPSRAERTLAAVALAISLGVSIWLLTRGLKVGTRPHVDFFDFFWAARGFTDNLDIYAVGDPGYIYPPLLAFLMQPLALLDATLAASCWAVLNIVIAWVLCALSVNTATTLLNLRWSWARRVLAACVTGWILADGFRNELEWGNCNFLILIGVVLGIRWLTHRPIAAGCALAFAAALKYLPILFLVWLLARGKWRAAAAMTLCLVALLLLPAAQVGWDRNAAFLGSSVRGVSSMLASRHADQDALKLAPDAPPPGAPTLQANIWPLDADFSLSIPSGMARVARDTGLRESLGHAAPLALTLMVALACVGVCALIYRAAGLPLWWLARLTPARLTPASRVPAWLAPLEAVGVSTAMVVFSPQAQKRHFNMLVPLVALCVVLIWRGYSRASPPSPASPHSHRAAAHWTLAGLLIMAALATPMINTPLTRDFMTFRWEWCGGPSLAILACQFIALASFMKSARL